MKPVKLVTAVITATLFSCQSVYAEDNNLVSQYCSLMSQFAEKIMDGRHNGISMRKATEFANALEEPKIRAYVQTMVEKAYASPKYASEEYKQQAVVEFGNTWYQVCMQFETKVEM